MDVVLSYSEDDGEAMWVEKKISKQSPLSQPPPPPSTLPLPLLLLL